MPAYIDKKNVELFTKHAVLTETEMRARYEIHLENYCKVSAIEANTLLDMAQRSILPVAARYSGDLAKGMAHKQEAGLASTCRLEEHLIRRISGLSDQLLDVCQDLSQALEKAPAADSGIEAAHYFRGEINTRVRQAGDLISSWNPWWTPRCGLILPMPTSCLGCKVYLLYNDCKKWTEAMPPSHFSATYTVRRWPSPFFGTVRSVPPCTR